MCIFVLVVFFFYFIFFVCVDFFFFFSSRRRHTRLQGDWSSDVCSSDLAPNRAGLEMSASAACTSPNRISVYWLAPAEATDADPARALCDGATRCPRIP